MSEKFLFVGLGNIGKEYEHTRHNIGFDVVDAYAKQKNIEFSISTLGLKTDTIVKGRKIIIIKPTTYMNLSGKALKYWMDKEKVALENVLVIVDDLALPTSKAKIKQQGSHAGHNGLKNIEEILGTNAYARLKFGIGNDFRKGDQVAFVLGKWDENEKSLIEHKIRACSEILDEYVLAGASIAMNKLNTLTFS